jgi:cytochrome c
MRGLIIGAVVVAASSTAALAQDIEAGQISFKKCQPCHDVGEAAKNKIGPTLNGLDGRKSGVFLAVRAQVGTPAAIWVYRTAD